MIENISKKQEKIQEKIQKQQELNDKDCRELTDEELDQIVGGMPGAAEVSTVQLATLGQFVTVMPVAGVAVQVIQGVQTLGARTKEN